MNHFDVLLTCLRHFKTMDEANAAVHCAKVKYSPLTFRLAEAMDSDDPMVRVHYEASEVLRHKGKYKLDKGR